MGLLARSIQSFRSARVCGSVAEASETDGLLRAANRLVAFFPVYSALGRYVCEVQYSRYLERRSKRIARASACTAALKLTATCALSSIDSIMVDGETDETSKVYSIWLTPSGKTADVFKKAIADLILGQRCWEARADQLDTIITHPAVDHDAAQTPLHNSGMSQQILSSNLDAPSFEPHVTLGHVSGEEREVLQLVERFARETAAFAVDAGPPFSQRCDGKQRVLTILTNG
eukprot:Skav223661  [mRNA]  locus=scaffold2794:33918:36938:+ [translate_table: standard]